MGRGDGVRVEGRKRGEERRKRRHTHTHIRVLAGSSILRAFEDRGFRGGPRGRSN